MSKSINFKIGMVGIEKNTGKCPHCEFIDNTFSPILGRKDSTNREYWLMTEVFVYLHGGDECNLRK